MNRQQAINYLSNSGFSMIQVETIVKALSTLSEVDFQELKDRYGDEVEYVVRDMVSGENLRWVELPRPKKQEPTTKNNLEVEHHKQNIQAYAQDFGVSEEQAEKELRVTTKNDLAVEEHKGEVMDFPNTFDEFADDYGFKDTKEVYTNGSELIQVYRVKQWLEHINEKTTMIDKSNFSQEQYKADLQSAYDCGYAQAKNNLEARMN